MSVVQRPLAETDIDACLRLVAEASWNQTANDWKTIFEIGETRGLFDGDRLIATAAIVLHGSVGWVCMVLVTPAAQRRGHATHLLNWAGSRLDELGLIAGLDATPAGRQVYQHLGYNDIYPITRMQCEAPIRAGPDVSHHLIRPVGDDDLDAMLALDRRAFGMDRSALVASLIHRRPDLACGIFHGDVCISFALAREGRRATQIGPLVASNEELATALLHHVLDTLEGPAFIDVPDSHSGLHAALEGRGFNIQRQFTRMLRGRTEALDDSSLIFALTGPEFA